MSCEFVGTIEEIPFETLGSYSLLATVVWLDFVAPISRKRHSHRATTFPLASPIATWQDCFGFNGAAADTLSRLRLIANCTRGCCAQAKIVTRMHRFFEDLNPSMVNRLEALMTNERAEHFLMDRTIADSRLITRDNYEEIYREIEEVAAERVTLKKNAELSELQSAHAQQLSAITSSHQERLLEETTTSLELQREVERRERSEKT